MAIKRKRINSGVGAANNAPFLALAPEPINAKRAPTSLDVAEIGTIWIDNTAPSFWILTTITSAGAVWTSNGSTENLEFVSDSGSAFPEANQIEFLGTGGITTSAANNVVTINGSGVGISITGNSGGALSGNAFTFTGGTTGLDFAGTAAPDTLTLTGTLVVSNGGTGATTLTANALMIGNGTSAITSLAAATDGQLVIGSTGVAPVVAALTEGEGISIVNGAGSIEISSSGSTTLAWKNITNAMSPYAVIAADDSYLSVDVTGGVVTIQLPDAAVLGKVYYVKDRVGLAATSNITITTVSGVTTIDGATSFVMNSAYQSVNIIGNSTSYELF